MVAILAGGVLCLIVAGSFLRDALVRLFAEVLRSVAETREASKGLLPDVSKPVLIVLGACAASSLAGAIAVTIQTKGGFWPNLALPDVNRLAQGFRFGRIFSKEFLADLGLSFVKVLTLAAVIWQSVKNDFVSLNRLVHAPADKVLEPAFAPLSRAAVKVLLAFGILAGIDLLIARRRHMAKMKMTPQEAKREHREEEGDPMLKGRRRRKHRELARGRAAVDVPRADALVVNPTHIAIAIRYRKDEGKAPRVICKGKGRLAEVMRDLARENGVPIVEDVPLARLLYKRVKVGREVPAETYRAVAAILAFVYRITGRNPGA